ALVALSLICLVPTVPCARAQSLLLSDVLNVLPLPNVLSQPVLFPDVRCAKLLQWPTVFLYPLNLSTPDHRQQLPSQAPLFSAALSGFAGLAQSVLLFFFDFFYAQV